MIIIICLEILTVDGIEVQCGQAAATLKRLLSDGSNAVPNGYRSQTSATSKRTISDGSNAIIQYG